jgi:hypothetical protein
MIRNFFSIWREAKVIAKEKRKEELDIKQRKDIAKLFNKRYTYLNEYVPNLERLPGNGMYGFTARVGYAWMCPDCNKIHHPTHQDVWTGIQYPKCCYTPEGHR